MTNLKTAIFITLILFLSLVGYSYFSYDITYAIDKVYHLWLQQEYQQSHEKLTDLSKGLSQSEYHLYRAYIFREEGRLDASDRHLNLATKEHNDDLNVELDLNHVMNAYLSSDYELFTQKIKQLPQISRYQSYVSFFLGLQAYLSNDYKKALKLLSVKTSDAPSLWFEKAFSHAFSSNWQQTHIAHCNIELGKYVQARNLLEQLKKNSDKAFQDKVFFLIGLSYLKEANEKPVNVAIPYYHIALSYFSYLPLKQPGLQNEKNTIALHLINFSKSLLDHNLFKDASPFILALHAFDSLASPETLNISNKIENLIEDKEYFLQLCNMLKAIKCIEPLRSVLYQKLEALVENTNGRLPIDSYWTIAEILSNHSNLSKPLFIHTAQEKIRQSIDSEVDSLSEISPYLLLFDDLEKDATSRLYFTKELISKAFHLVKTDQSKALQLISLAIRIPFLDQRDEMQHFLEARLIKDYEYAHANEETQTLPALETLFQTYRIAIPSFEG